MNDDTPSAPPTLTLLSRAQILTVDDTAYEVVPVPQWGGAVRVRSLSAADRVALEALMATNKKMNRPEDAGFREKVLVLGCVDEKNVPLFTDNDAAEIAKRHAGVVDLVAAAVARLSKLGADAIDEAAGN